MQTTMPMASSKMSLKLFIDKRSNRVLFAEASKEFIDFLFNILLLLVGTLITLLKQDIMLGSLGNIHDSIINLSLAYLEPNKDSRLKPNVRISGDTVVPLRFSNILSSIDRKFYDTKYPSCGSRYSSMRSKLKFCPPNGVKKAPCLVMNDLEVKPLSTVSVITLLNKFHLKKDGDLREKVVDLGMDEVCVYIYIYICQFFHHFLCMHIMYYFFYNFYFFLVPLLKVHLVYKTFMNV